jgi:hypothetical protein
LHVSGTVTATGITNITNTTDSNSFTSGALVVSGGTGIGKRLTVGGNVEFYNTDPSTSIGTGALIVRGGLSIQCNDNSSNFGNGGALTVGGGAAIAGDLWVGGEINGSGSSSSTFAYLTLTATDEAVNLTSGALVTFGGITIQATTNATSVTNGGSFLVNGGASFNGDIYVGGSQYIYDSTNIYNQTDSVLNIYDIDTLRYSVNRNVLTNDFAILRYNSSGSLIENAFTISSDFGYTTFSNTSASSSPLHAAIVVGGGISINSTQIASSFTSGGGLTVAGGQSVAKNMLIGGDVRVYSTSQSNDTSSGSLIVDGGVAVKGNVNIAQNVKVSGSFTTDQELNYQGNGLLQYLNNNNTTQSSWIYFGQLHTGHTHLEVGAGETGQSEMSEIHFYAAIGTSSNSYYHNVFGNKDTLVTLFVYNDTSNDHLFALVSPNTELRVNVKHTPTTRFQLANEGISTEPDGTASGYLNTWVDVYDTTKNSNVDFQVGSLTVHGNSLNVADNLPVLGYNNDSVNNSRDLGVLLQRYQKSNDSGAGDIVTDNPVFVDSIPSQTGTSTTQIRFSNLASSSDAFYNGWWIRVGGGSNMDQVRRVIDYNGSLRVATIDTPWTSQNPSNGDTINFFSSTYIANYYNESNKRFKLAYAAKDVTSGSLVHYDNADLEVKRLYISDTTPSTNGSSGSLYTLGGISINNTNDATNSVNGGTFTTLGGGSFAKTLLVGGNVGIGQNPLFTPQESVHINSSTSNIRLDHDNNLYSYIDFVETGTTNRYGLLNDSASNQFAITYNSTSNTPINSSRAIVITSTGNVGINTSDNINSALTIQNNNFITTNATDGFIGIKAADNNAQNNSGGSRLEMFGSSAVNSAGSIGLHTGSSGSLSVFTSTDIERLRLNSAGSLQIFSTAYSKSSTSGALQVYGGIAIASTENAQNVSNGGSLTVSGGVSIQKDIFVGGNLYITGTLNAGSSSSPTLSFTNTQGCSISSYGNTQLISVSNEGIFTFYIEVIPSVESENCQFEFVVPSRTNAFTNRGDIVISCSGYTDDTQIIPLFNLIGVGVTGTNTALIKFQSVSTNVHYIQVLCRYTMA